MKVIEKAEYSKEYIEIAQNTQELFHYRRKTIEGKNLLSISYMIWSVKHRVSKGKKTVQGNQEEKFRKFFWLYNKWMYLKNNNIHVVSHPLLRESKSISIYGLGEIGKRLIEELENDGIKISYVIDKNAMNYFADFELYTLNEKLPTTECIIITPIYEFEFIKEDLKNKVNGQIISFEEIIDDLWEESWKEE